MKVTKLIIVILLGLLFIVGCSNDDDDNEFPEIKNVTLLPEEPVGGEIVRIEAEITDEDGTLEIVRLEYDVDGGEVTLVNMDHDAGSTIYFVDIGPFADSVTVNFAIEAIDNDDDATVYDGSFTITASPTIIELYINEYMASNDYGPVDENGEHDDWIEIYNAGADPVDIGGMFVTDDLTDLACSMIPEGFSDLTTIEPGGYLILWADKEEEQGPLHLSDVKLSSGGEQIGLTDRDSTTVLDSLTYGEQTTDVSCGRLPDGSANWDYFGAGHETMFTPGAANGTGEIPIFLFYINEFMASNDTTIADSAGDYDDWIEIYNAGNICGDIGGYYLTDDLGELNQSQIPDSLSDITTIPPLGFLLLWADKEEEQGPLHLADTKLSGDGEQIGLTAPDGTTIIDSLTFGEQTTDVSYGRLPDGTDVWQFFNNPTPGTSNQP
ncbi:MAG: lamin tail domain-containing protein [Candidatus Cloacimonadota bacterium]|nr:lamin tail domain-containing protein [Candidatus Cloacimonadota bacterium]